MTDIQAIDALAQAIADAETRAGGAIDKDEALVLAQIFGAIGWKAGVVYPGNVWVQQVIGIARVAYSEGRASRGVPIKSPLEDKIEGLQADLDAALDIIQRRGDAEAREWLRLNYPRRTNIKGSAA